MKWFPFTIIGRSHYVEIVGAMYETNADLFQILLSIQYPNLRVVGVVTKMTVKSSSVEHRLCTSVFLMVQSIYNSPQQLGS
jgi:hypothetical protein